MVRRLLVSLSVPLSSNAVLDDDADHHDDADDDGDPLDADHGSGKFHKKRFQTPAGENCCQDKTKIFCHFRNLTLLKKSFNKSGSPNFH